MRDSTNRQWRVAAYPRPGELVGVKHFDWVEEPVPEPADDEFLVRTICLAPGPAQRGYLKAPDDGFLQGIRIEEVMRGRGVGQIVASRHPDYAVGEFFVGSLGWQDFSVQRPRGAEVVFSTTKVENPVKPLSSQLSFLGQAGATAWFGLHEAGDIKRGDNVLVTAAGGGVGSMACQVAKLEGAGRVVGMTGSNEKCRWLVEDLGAYAAINYRTDNVDQCLDKLFPDGIDVMFDNVGGELLNTALEHLAMNARVALCGFIATDYKPGPLHGPINYRQLIHRRACMQGFVVFDYWERWAEAEAALLGWYRDGKLVNCEDVDEGLEKMPDALASLFTGGNRGIKICRVAPDPVGLPDA
jgi:NADPH-dependent curcumin reductase CurA